MTTLAPDTLDREGSELVVQVQTITIVDAESFDQAAGMLRQVKQYLARVAEVFDPMQDAAVRAHREILAQRRKVEAHAVEAERALKGAMTTYQHAQEVRRREAEAAARAEQARLEAEERARVEAERRRLAAAEEERRLEAAVAAEAAGDRERADRILAAPSPVPVVAPRPVFVPPAIVPAAPRAAGVAFRETWTAEVVDLAELVRAVADGRAALTLVKADEVALNSLARALRGALNVPGVRAVSKSTVAARVS